MTHTKLVTTVLATMTAAAALGGCSSSPAEAAGRGGPKFFKASSDLVVVELFQSQGCSSCPPANAYLNVLADRADVLTLSFAVTYWDRLGWKDTFAAPAFTARQKDYSHAGTGEVATPEFIVDGKAAVLGSNRRELDAAISRARSSDRGPRVSLSPMIARIGSAPGQGTADVWLVRYDPRWREVPIGAGENVGRTLPHRHIVRQLVRVGTWNGTEMAYRLSPAREAGLDTAILVQRSAGGPIIAVGAL